MLDASSGAWLLRRAWCQLITFEVVGGDVARLCNTAVVCVAVPRSIEQCPLLSNAFMNGKSDEPDNIPERRSKERVSDDANWEAKVLARVRSRLKQSAAGQGEGENNWEQDVLKAMRDKLEKKSD